MKADLEKAKREYPSIEQLGDDGWVSFFGTPAGKHAIGRILGDIYNKVLDEEERQAGVRRVGRRPARAEVPLSEVYKVVFPPRYSLDPFPKALESLLNGRSQRQFAAKIPCNQSTFSRFLSGEKEPNLLMMERIAAAAGVRPGFFVEYRARFIGELVTTVLLRNPNVGVNAMREIVHTRRSFAAELEAGQAAA